MPHTEQCVLSIPAEIGDIVDHQKDIPRIAKDARLIDVIEAAVTELPTTHDLYRHDSREIDFLKPHSVHLVVTQRLSRFF